MRRSLFWLLDQYADCGGQGASLELARLADRLGYEALWLAEHHFSQLGTAPNPAVLLSAIAQHTETLRLGPAVSVLPLRDPIHVAEDYALVDVLSNGRLNMGVGTGSQPLEFEGFGVELDRKRELFDAAFAELLARWQAAARGDVGAKSINVTPLQSPTPPVYVATLDESGAHAIGLQGHSMLTLLTPASTSFEDASGRVAAHARGLREAGHPETSARAVVVALTHAGESTERAREVAVPALGRLFERMAAFASPDAGALYDMMVERDTGLFGTEATVEKQLARYADQGIQDVAFFTRFGGLSRDDTAATIRNLAPTDPA